MHVTLLDVPDSVSIELERAFQTQGFALDCRRLALEGASLSQVFPPGLVVFWEPEGSLEHSLAVCRQLVSVCILSRSCLILLTRRNEAEQNELVMAGVGDCISPQGELWAPHLMTLARRMGLPTREGAPPGGPQASRVPPERALKTLLAATTADLGHDFFRTLVQQLADAFRVTCAMVGELRPEQDAIETLAFWMGSFQDNVTYPLRGTPCHNAVVCSVCHYADEVSERFPEDLMLTDFGLRGYLGAALRSTQGEVIGVLAILHDQPLEAGELDFALLSAFAARAGAELERVRAHAELERTRDFLRNTLNAVPDPLYVKDRSHRWVAVNSAFCDSMQRSAPELLGKRAADVLSTREAQTFWAQDEHSFVSGQPSENEVSLTDGSGLPRSLLIKRAVFPGADGQPALVSIVRDLTERKRLETQLRLADRMASMGTLAAGVAHEINNPLAYVCANLTFLREQLEEPMLLPDSMAELREVVQETREGADRVRSIVQDLKTFSRGDEESRGLVNLHQVINGALRLMRNELQSHNAQLERELSPVPAVLGNEARLGQVLVNLLVNALQAFPDKRPEPNRIRVRTRCDESRHVLVEIEDNGVGMSPEVMQHIFEPFFTTKPVGVGTGLGLAICHTIIQSMGGQISVRSTPGRGTTFAVSLPIFEEQEEEERPACPEPSSRVTREAAPESLPAFNEPPSRVTRAS